MRRDVEVFPTSGRKNFLRHDVEVVTTSCRKDVDRLGSIARPDER